ncbi:MAG: RNA methyltransferase [Candidatus Bathyarchaeia archaeon]
MLPREGLRLRVVLVEPESGGNIGSVARAMKNFGLKDLWLVNPKARIDESARAMASHAIDVLEGAKVVGELREAIRGVDLAIGTTSKPSFGRSNLRRIPLAPEELAERLGRAKGAVALILGRESIGLTNEELEECDLIVSIPASEEYPVLNVAASAAIILYEVHKGSSRGWPQRRIASEGIKRRLEDRLLNLAELAGIPGHRAKLASRALRNVLSRSFATEREASLLLGILRKASDRALGGGRRI